MTLPSSGQLTMTDLAGEFGGSAPYFLTNYYAGGGLVPSGTVSPISGAVPSSGQITIENFYGTSNYLQFVTITIGNSGGAFPLYGYSASIGFGSISNPNFFAGGTFEEFWWNSSNHNVVLSINATGISQGAFATMDIEGNLYNSVSASFIDNGSTCTWTWVSGNPFGFSGSANCQFN